MPITNKIFVFFRPEYLKISISLFEKSLIKNNWVEIRKINGNISKIVAGEFSNDKNKVRLIPTFISLKNSNSDKIFKIKTKLKITQVT